MMIDYVLPGMWKMLPLLNYGRPHITTKGGPKTFKMNQRKERALTQRRLQRRRDRH